MEKKAVDRKISFQGICKRFRCTFRGTLKARRSQNSMIEATNNLKANNHFKELSISPKAYFITIDINKIGISQSRNHSLKRPFTRSEDSTVVCGRQLCCRKLLSFILFLNLIDKLNNLLKFDRYCLGRYNDSLHRTDVHYPRVWLHFTCGTKLRNCT